MSTSTTRLSRVSHDTHVATHVWVGRALLLLAFLAMLGAWVTQITGQPLMGMDQQHLYKDATILALLGIGAFVSSFVHMKGF